MTHVKTLLQLSLHGIIRRFQGQLSGGRISICTQFVWKCVRDADAQTLPFTGAEGEEERMTGDLRTCSS